MTHQTPDRRLKETLTRRGFLCRQLLPVAASALFPFAINAKTHSRLGSAVISCAGTYTGHLQGVCLDPEDNLYWSFTTTLVKTDRLGNVLKQMPVVTHHGAPCYADGKLYVAVNLGKFNEAKEAADSWIYVYDATDLSLVRRQRIGEAIYGAGGIAHKGDSFVVVGGLPEGFTENYLYEYDHQLKYIRTITLKSGYTTKGIQTAVYSNGYWWFGCYGTPETLLRTDDRFQAISSFSFDCALGLIPIGRRFLVARGRTACLEEHGCTGQLIPAERSEERGLRLLPGPWTRERLADNNG